uniref:Ig-like domain-containing protein n=1 Tax=Salarias fasciatus TaxID=181472 RepID=A0A672II70_SALFA
MATRRDDSYSSTTWSEAFTLLSDPPVLSFHPVLCFLTWTVPNKATLTLQHDRPQLYQGETIALRCAIDGGNTGWEYEWETSSLLKPPNVSQYRMEALSSQHQGEYRCKGNKLRGAQSTDWSNTVTLTVIITNKPVITRQPSWSQIFQGEKITLTCEVQGGEKTDWRYYWRRNSRSLPNEDEKMLQLTASESLNGEYECKTRRRDDFYSSTTWSEAFTLILSVSPSWLIPGASVTLICHTEPPSAGWSFYWFKAVPNSQDSYTYEPLPGTSSGTANNSFTVHGQTHTAGYACSAGRGDPLIYTQYSRPTFVWSSGQFVFLEHLNCCLPAATIEMPSFTEPWCFVQVFIHQRLSQ